MYRMRKEFELHFGREHKKTHQVQFVCTCSFSLLFYYYSLFIMPYDIENYSSIRNHDELSRGEQQQQRQRIVLFGILVIVSMICVFVSYVVSSVSKPTCSDQIIWVPSCNREEYLHEWNHIIYPFHITNKDSCTRTRPTMSRLFG